MKLAQRNQTGQLERVRNHKRKNFQSLFIERFF
jgi:hypothetical protein